MNSITQIKSDCNLLQDIRKNRVSSHQFREYRDDITNKKNNTNNAINQRVIAKNIHSKIASVEYNPHLIVNSKEMDSIVLGKEKSIYDSTYAAASYQIAKDIFAIDQKLKVILNSDRQILVKNLDIPYIRTTVFELLRRVDAGNSEGAKEYMAQRLRHSNPEYKKPLEAINYVINGLIQWKQNFKQWKENIDKNVDSVLANFNEELKLSSWTVQKKQEIYDGVSAKLKKVSNELLAHLLRDIAKTARGLIGIVNLSNTGTLQLIVNLSANCSMRKKMSHDTEFQRYVSELRKAAKQILDLGTSPVNAVSSVKLIDIPVHEDGPWEKIELAKNAEGFYLPIHIPKEIFPDLEGIMFQWEFQLRNATEKWVEIKDGARPGIEGLEFKYLKQELSVKINSSADIDQLNGLKFRLKMIGKDRVEIAMQAQPTTIIFSEQIEEKIDFVGYRVVDGKVDLTQTLSLPETASNNWNYSSDPHPGTMPDHPIDEDPIIPNIHRSRPNRNRDKYNDYLLSRYIIGEDDRTRVKNTDEMPPVGLLQANRSGNGSAVVIGKDLVMTSLHYIYDSEHGFYNDITFRGMQNHEYKFFPEYTAKVSEIWVHRELYKKPDGEETYKDFAILRLDKDVGLTMGHIGLNAVPGIYNLNDRPVEAVSYPGDKRGGGEAWKSTGNVLKDTLDHPSTSKKLTNHGANVIDTDLDIAGGTSGAALYYWKSGKRYAIGVLVQGHHVIGSYPMVPIRTRSIRITKHIFDAIHLLKNRSETV